METKKEATFDALWLHQLSLQWDWYISLDNSLVYNGQSIMVSV